MVVGVTDVRAFFPSANFFFCLGSSLCAWGRSSCASCVCLCAFCVDVRGCLRESSARCNFSPLAW